MLENTNNPTCNYEEELVSYLYDEMSNSDKLQFETHLEKCSACQDELAGFSMARSSIVEWKNEEFLPLQNPAIEISYPNEVRTISRSWFAAVRDLFTLSPAWVTASTAFAALAICLGLFAVVVSSLRDDKNVAGIEKGNTKIIPSPTNGNQNQNTNVSNSNSNQNKSKPVNSPEPDIIETAQKPLKTTVAPTKISTKTNVVTSPNAPVRTVLPKSDTRNNRQPVKTQKQKAPSFLDDADEEDSLTLTDLLEEIGSREIDD